MNLHIDGTKVREWNLFADPFPFEVVHVDEPANNMNVNHCHRFMEISYISEGKGLYEIDNTRFPVSQGDIVMIKKNEKHRVMYNPDEPLYQAVIHFDPSIIWPADKMNFWQSAEKTLVVNHMEDYPDQKDAVQAIVTEIVEEYKKANSYYQMMIKSKLLELIVLLCRVRPRTYLDTTLPSDMHCQSVRIEKILQYVNENYNKDISLKTISDKFYINASYFSEYFKRSTGVNFTQYVAELRVRQSIRLLMNHEHNVVDVAFSCGFNNSSSFYNTFKRVTGMNPGDYIKLCRKKAM